MSNDGQSHEEVAQRVADEERRASVRHAARSLGSVTARIIGGSEVDLVNFSNRGVLFECDSRLLIGARTSVRITTPDDNLIISGRVVRSRVKGLVNGALRYDAALVLDTELGLVPRFLNVTAPSDAGSDADVLEALESEPRATFDPSPVEAYLAESEASLIEVAHGSALPFPTPDVPAPVAGAELDVAPEPPPVPEFVGQPIETTELEVPAGHEPGTSEADAEIAFEPAVEFAFDESGEPSLDAVGPTALHDGAAAVPAIEAGGLDAPPPSFFDARPSDSYDAAPADAFTASALSDAAMDDVTDSHAAASDTEDRVLLQFAATVPHDLAELRRLAADNQW